MSTSICDKVQTFTFNTKLIGVKINFAHSSELQRIRYRYSFMVNSQGYVGFPSNGPRDRHIEQKIEDRIRERGRISSGGEDQRRSSDPRQSRRATRARAGYGTSDITSSRAERTASRVPRTNGGGRTRSAMTRGPAIPANRAIPSLYICTWRWRSPGPLLQLDGFLRGNGECWRGSGASSVRERSAIGVGVARRPRRPRNPRNFASSARAGVHRAGSPKMAGAVSAFCCGGGDGGPLGADRYARRRIPAMAATVVARHASWGKRKSASGHASAAARTVPRWW